MVWVCLFIFLVVDIVVLKGWFCRIDLFFNIRVVIGMEYKVGGV